MRRIACIYVADEEPWAQHIDDPEDRDDLYEFLVEAVFDNCFEDELEDGEGLTYDDPDSVLSYRHDGEVQFMRAVQDVNDRELEGWIVWSDGETNDGEGFGRETIDELMEDAIEGMNLYLFEFNIGVVDDEDYEEEEEEDEEEDEDDEYDYEDDDYDLDDDDDDEDYEDEEFEDEEIYEEEEEF